jgi:chemotaxis response regulator CheB
MIPTQEKKRETRKATTFLVLDGQPTVRRRLVQLINQDLGSRVCSEADSTDHALELMYDQCPDCAVVAIPFNSGRCVKFMKEAALRHPALAILKVRLGEISDVAERAADQEAAGQVTAAIHFIKSLLRSGIFGFVVATDPERNRR